MSDFDDNGFIDLFVTNGHGPRPFNDGPAQLFRNMGNANHWIKLDLEGVQSNRDAIGTVVYVTVGGITQVREFQGGVHRLSQDQRQLHFGLGGFSSIERIEIHWPTGAVSTLSDVEADQTLRLTEPSQ